MKPAGILDGALQILRDPLRRNSLFLLATHGVIALFGFFFWRVAEGQYGTAAVGEATVMVSAVLLLHTLARLGFDIGLIRFLPGETDKPAMINTSFTIVGLFSAFLALVFLLGVGIWAPVLDFVRDNLWYALLFIVFTVVTSLVALLRQGVFVAYRGTQSSLAVEIVGGIRLPLLLAFVYVGAFGIFVAWGLAGAVAMFAGILLVILVERSYRPVPAVRGRILGSTIRFSLSNYVAETFRELPGFVLPLIVVGVFRVSLGEELGKEMGAYFYIAWTIASVVMRISYATGSSLLAEGSLDPGNFGSSRSRAVRFMLLLLALAILVVFVAGGWVLTWFGDGYSENALWLLRVLSVSGVPIAVNTIYVTQKRIERKMWPVIIVYAFVACFTVGVGYALMDRLELLGIGVAWLAGNCLVAAVVGFLMITARGRVRGSQSQGSEEASTS
jgi:O-antigen/teichoic acid export membrane protein